MGWCCENRCWNLPHQYQMGWNAVRHFANNTLVRGRTYNVSLTSQSTLIAAAFPAKTGIRIAPWTPPSLGVLPVWISYRTEERGDIVPDPFPNSPLVYFSPLWDNVHIHSAAINSPTDSEFTYLEATLSGERARARCRLRQGSMLAAAGGCASRWHPPHRTRHGGRPAQWDRPAWACA